MPGHVKRGGTGEPDPDPSPYLFVSYDDKQKDLAKVCTIICTIYHHIVEGMYRVIKLLFLKPKISLLGGILTVNFHIYVYLIQQCYKVHEIVERFAKISCGGKSYFFLLSCYKKKLQHHHKNMMRLTEKCIEFSFSSVLNFYFFSFF